MNSTNLIRKIAFNLFIVQYMFGFISCHSQCIERINTSTEKKYPIKRDIPLNNHGDHDFFFNEAQRITSKLGLKRLDSGFDSLQIRVWYPELRKNNKVVIISKRAEEWEGHIVTFDEEYDVFKGIDSIVNIKCKEIFPESKWDEFVQKLFKLNITSLPDVSRLPGIPGAGADGESYSVEIATTKLYRFYSYNQPVEYLHIEQVRKMSDIINLLNEEFHLNE